MLIVVILFIFFKITLATLRGDRQGISIPKYKGTTVALQQCKYLLCLSKGETA
jgi:hypothetical protein